jgi:hypothetical protein
MINLFSSKPRPVAVILSSFNSIVDELKDRAAAARDEAQAKFAEADALVAKADDLLDEAAIASSAALNIGKLIGINTDLPDVVEEDAK